MDETKPTFREALRFWLKLGFISFGGPAGQIAIMHSELVDRKRWIGEERFLHALNFCMLLPGPEATQLAIYCGWRLHRTIGGIVAGVLFVLPSIVLLWVLSYVYVVHGKVPWIAAIFYGLKPAVTAIVAAAVIRIGQRALKTPFSWALAAAAFVLIYFCHVPFPWIVAGAGVAGWVATSNVRLPSLETVPAAEEKPTGAGWRRALKVAGVSLLVWWLPVELLWWIIGDGALVREGIFFSKAALVTFGGAYAVLPYVGQQASEHYGWLSSSQMLDGLGLAETTPGPLIMVVQFVGFLGGWNHPAPLRPLVSATLGALITTWTTFVPCFLWILLGAPYLERLRHHVRIAAAQAAVTAAVVGVVLNLAVWFGVQTLRPAAGWDWFALVVVAFGALQRYKVSVVTTVIASGALGLAWTFLRGGL